MRTVLDVDPDTLDEHERNFTDQIRKHGWFRTTVAGDDEGPGFSYTTGLWLTLGTPELIVFALTPQIAHQVLWDTFNDLEGGRSLPIGRPLDDVFANLAAYVFPVASRHYPDLLGWSRWFYGGDDFPFRQIVWPDPGGVFPWQPGMDDHFAGLQPDLSDEGWENLLQRDN
jgi:hypothetical protein